MSVIEKTFQYGDCTITLETGAIARQATGAVLVSMGDTVVLVTVVGIPGEMGEQSFFPLTVNYQERYYSTGKMPGGYFKREGRPTMKETLTSRLIDRPIRPLFPQEFHNEVQIVATVISMDPQVNADVPAIIGASAALAISGLPFNGPLAAARVGYCQGQYLLNPTIEKLKTSELDLVVAGTENAVLMVESEAKELSEEIMLGAVMFGHQHMRVVIQAIKELAEEAGKPDWGWQPPVRNEALVEKVSNMASSSVDKAYKIQEKQKRQTKLSEIRDHIVSELCSEEVEGLTKEKIKNVFSELEEKIVRRQILSNRSRIDGRDLKTVRPINIKLGVFPRTHGSAIFTRGETQAIVITTLGTGRDAQLVDEPLGDYKEKFMLHYNFPPYSVGEVGLMSGPKRREIGHGNLARRALQAVIPQGDDFPYVIRAVSEITESNGSSSMATVCGTSLALMDAGVPIKAPVAGIAMGLIKETDQFAVLTDILGDEDHLGDMDFKVAGTNKGITALQMDIKIDGITEEIMRTALEQAKEGRMHILSIMDQAINKPRHEVSQLAPRIITMKINPDKIRDVIGKGGATIRALVEETGASIDINDDGTVTIAAVDGKAGEAAKRRVEALTAEPEVGKVYEGKVMKITDFGAFVNIMPGRDGLVHISQITHERVENVMDHLREGQIVRVKVLEVDRQGKIRLSIKEVGTSA